MARLHVVVDVSGSNVAWGSVARDCRVNGVFGRSKDTHCFPMLP